MNRHLKLVLEVVFTALLAVGILLLYFSSAPGEKDGLAHADKKTADHGDEISDSGNHGIDVSPTQNSSRNDSSSSQEEKSKNWATGKE